MPTAVQITLIVCATLVVLAMLGVTGRKKP